jgi:hypothetical protein
LLDKFSNGGWFSECTARAKMNDPVRKAMIHHAGKLGKLYTIAMQVDAAWRTVKGKIQHAVVTFTELIEVVLQLFACIAC